jgi:Bor protein
MSKRLAAATILLILTPLTGCHKLYFHNGPVEDSYTQDPRYHHEVAFELVELSDPVNLDRVCEGKEWHVVKTERTATNTLIGFITQPIYGQWTVSQSCKP